jgi:hypothetical protein
MLKKIRTHAKFEARVNYLRLQSASKPMRPHPPIISYPAIVTPPQNFYYIFLFFLPQKCLTDTSTHDYYCVKYTQENSNVETYVEKV